MGKKFFLESKENVRYDARYYREVLQLPALQERLYQLLVVFKSFSDAFFLDFGTLLGAYRNARMIPWDDDIDVGMLKDDLLALPSKCQVTPDAIFEVNPNTKQGHFDELNRVDARLICTQTGAYIDVFSYWPQKENLFTSWERVYCKKESVPRETLLPFGGIQFAGEEYSSPHDPRSYLVLTYGNDLTPDHRRIVGPDGKIRYERIR